MHDRHRTAAQAAEMPSDEVLLAGLRRAALHDPRKRQLAPIWVLLEHLEIPRRSVRARFLRERLAALERRKWLERHSAHGVPMWALTAAGMRHLRRAERSAAPIPLSESPQHRAWRRARTLAAHEVERFAAALRRSSADVELMLQDDRSGTLPSDAWLELGARLALDCRRLASARYCLSEWAEPDDGDVDIDTLGAAGDELLDHGRLRALRVLRAGRRNTRLWRERD